MHKGVNQQTPSTTFTTSDDQAGDGELAEGSPETARSPVRAIHRKYSGIALLASLAIHAFLLGLVSVVRPAIMPTEALATKMLMISLTSSEATPSNSIASPGQTQPAVQPLPLPVPEPPQPLQAQAEPIPAPKAPAEPALVRLDSQVGSEAFDAFTEVSDPPLSPAAWNPPATSDNRNQTVENTVQSLVSQLPMQATESQTPQTSMPDAVQISRDFKLAFMGLLAYPEAARRRGVQGTVGLRIVMDGEGRIVEALVNQTSGSSILDRAAVAAALATPGPLAGPGRRLELALRVSFEAGQVLARP